MGCQERGWRGRLVPSSGQPSLLLKDLLPHVFRQGRQEGGIHTLRYFNVAQNVGKVRLYPGSGGTTNSLTCSLLSCSCRRFFFCAGLSGNCGSLISCHGIFMIMILLLLRRLRQLFFTRHHDGWLHGGAFIAASALTDCRINFLSH